MKTIKLFDLFINLTLVGWFLIKRSWTDFEIMLDAYFIIGSWQVVSMLLHSYLGWFTKKWGARFVYHWITFILLITLPIGSFWILAVTGAPMAIFYSILCIVETCKIKKRPLSLLK